MKKIVALLFMAASFLLASKMSFQDEVNQQADYCDAVAEWKDTGGHGGHPDYDGIAGDVCKPEKAP